MFQTEEQKAIAERNTQQRLDSIRSIFNEAVRGGYKVHVRTNLLDGDFYVLRVGVYDAWILVKTHIPVRFVDVIEVVPVGASVEVHKMLNAKLYGEGESSVA